jgi:hypothetical protein
MAYMKEMAAFAEECGADSLNLNVVEARGAAAENFDDVVPLYTDVVDAADATGLDMGTQRLSLSRVPPCAGGSEWIQEDYHFAVHGKITHYDPGEGKLKGGICETCAVSRACPGIWEAYIGGHGWTGLVPLVHPSEREGLAARVDVRTPGLTRAMRRGFIDGYRRLELAGGDPLRDTRLPWLVRLARRIGHRDVLVESDARCLAPPGVAARLHELGLSEVVVAIRGATQESHDAATGEPGAFGEAVTAMGRMQQAGHTFSLRLFLPADDPAESERARELARTVNARELDVRVG